ncbi:tetratricopeptide repeat protein [Pseudomonas palleroniana]|uniref:tetratricopeptide repeat protein n=1 Tax=Pseudomonas TaxID=286 RepID=UPI001FD46A20|nr:hypothetical protein [Pseudomonas palleroniana]UOP10635.1 hypothetical protein LDL65_26785 [Pseudomonas palleroniana]
MYVDSQTLPALFTLLTQLNAQKSLLGETLQASLDQLNGIAGRIGFELFSLESYAQAELCLNITAARGHAEAQYAMSLCVSRRDGDLRIASEEARQWLKLAAAQNHIPALMRLGDADSLAKAREQLTPNAVAGDTQAMRLLFLLDKDVSWLDKAVARGDHTAQFQLAQAYRDTPQLIPNVVERRALVEELLQKAADGGDLQALADRVFSSKSSASVLEKQQRLIQLAGTGQLDALLEYGYALAGMPRNGKGKLNFAQRHPSAPRTYGLARDFAKAYAVLGLVLPKLPDYPAAEILKQDMNAIWHQMTLEQYSTCETLRLDLQARIPRVFKLMAPIIIVGRPSY